MRRVELIVLSVIVLGVLNFGIYQKEAILRDGTSIFLKLAPVDPRSLMQGDYMRLNYQMARDVQSGEVVDWPKRGYLVVKPDEKGVAQFVRFFEGGNLGQGELKIRYHGSYRIRIVPNSFLFQEGHASFYENAKYGVFTCDSNGKHLLTGLADENLQVIRPGSPQVQAE